MRKKYYTVYLKKTDEIVAAGNAIACAVAMNKNIQAFYSMVSRVRNGQNHKYEIDVSIVDLDDEN